MLNKFSKDRFLPVGPFRNDNDQLIDVSGHKIRLAHDMPAHPEPHDAVIVRRDIIHPMKVWDRKDPHMDYERALAKKFGVKLEAAADVKRKGRHVYVFMTGVAPVYSLTEFHVKHGDTVTVVLTNMDMVEDLTHGFCISHHDINFGISPQESVSATFKVRQRGVFWYYCTWFCHALHLEMRGRMIVT